MAHLVLAYTRANVPKEPFLLMQRQTNGQKKVNLTTCKILDKKNERLETKY